MIYRLLYPLHEAISAFNVFRYITFRTAMAVLTALLVSFLLGPGLIRRLRHFQIGQEIREEGPAHHQVKRGTPTMGGILILTAVVLPTILWADPASVYVWAAVLATVAGTATDAACTSSASVRSKAATSPASGLSRAFRSARKAASAALRAPSASHTQTAIS